MQKVIIIRSISLKNNSIQLQVKKKKRDKKKAYMESKTVMLINSAVMTTLIPFICEDINGTFTA